MLLPLGLSLAVLYLLNSAVMEQEAIAAIGMTHLTRWWLIAFSLVCIGAEFVVAALFFTPGEGMTYARSFLTWTFLGIIPGCLGLTRGVMLTPLVTVIPLTYFDAFTNGRPAWWNFPLNPGSASGAWGILAVVALVTLVLLRVERMAFFRRRFRPLI